MWEIVWTTLRLPLALPAWFYAAVLCCCVLGIIVVLFLSDDPKDKNQIELEEPEQTRD